MRIRTIKPEFFRHDSIFELEKASGLPLRLAYIGLWGVADREGRFKWEPRQIKIQVLPYDDVDFDDIMTTLASGRFIVPYEWDGYKFGYIPSFKAHQHINQRESQSVLPDPSACICTHVQEIRGPRGRSVRGELRETILARDNHKCLRCQSTEDLTIDHIFPICIGGNNNPANLRTLCRSCNSARPVAGQGLLDDLAIDGLELADLESICMHVLARGEGKGREKEKEGEKEGKGVKGKTSRTKFTDDEWLATVRVDPAYEGIDVMKEHGKMIFWCANKHKQPTRGRFLAWLNRIEKPMSGATRKPESNMVQETLKVREL